MASCEKTARRSTQNLYERIYLFYSMTANQTICILSTREAVFVTKSRESSGSI